MVELMRLFPAADQDELVYLNSIVAQMSESQASQFAMSYNARRKNPTYTLLLTILFWCGGRFYLGQIGMGVLYLLTFGCCGIGWIIDLFTYKTLTRKQNIEIAHEIALQMSMLNPETPAAPPSTVAVHAQQPAPSYNNVSVVCKSGAYAGQQFPVTAAGLVIGRDANSCSLVMQSGMLSRRHAKISPAMTAGNIILEDLNSTNGTFVFDNASWVKVTTPVTLSAYQSFRLGSQEVEFEVRA